MSYRYLHKIMLLQIKRERLERFNIYAHAKSFGLTYFVEYQDFPYCPELKRLLFGKYD